MFGTRSLLRLAVGAAAGYVLAVRPWHLRWGADDREVHGEMAGDDLVRSPQYQATRAVTVDAPPAAVWAWLVRLGGYRPGGGTPEPPATEEPLKVGDVLHPASDGTGYVVEQADPPHTLVLAQRGEDATTTCSVSLRDLDGRTRMVFRVRVRAQPGVRGTTYLASMDLVDFMAMRRQLLTIKERAESAH
ncbi:SRPBCC domain-containing protein [Nonomuraea sp. NPDC050451]|uniref:SRPBCC domain-containing protein n=1 Tax=Nonomuraea sp. NPDC050451 TaxID=3364364 RepID=UPI0037877E0D